MDTWLKIDEFCKLVNMDIEKVEMLVEQGDLRSQERDGNVFIEATSGTNAIIPKGEVEISNSDGSLPSNNFVEKTIGTILSLHEKVLESKDETLEALKSENKFLKDALYSMQEIYDEDKKTIETLSEQLRIMQEELEFTKRKYKLMWGRVVAKDEKKSDS